MVEAGEEEERAEDELGELGLQLAPGQRFYGPEEERSFDGRAPGGCRVLRFPHAQREQEAAIAADGLARDVERGVPVVDGLRAGGQRSHAAMSRPPAKSS